MKIELRKNDKWIFSHLHIYLISFTFHLFNNLKWSSPSSKIHIFFLLKRDQEIDSWIGWDFFSSSLLSFLSQAKKINGFCQKRVTYQNPCIQSKEVALPWFTVAWFWMAQPIWQWLSESSSTPTSLYLEHSSSILAPQRKRERERGRLGRTGPFSRVLQKHARGYVGSRNLRSSYWKKNSTNMFAIDYHLLCTIQGSWTPKRDPTTWD